MTNPTESQILAGLEAIDKMPDPQDVSIGYVGALGLQYESLEVILDTVRSSPHIQNMVAYTEMRTLLGQSFLKMAEAFGVKL